MAVVVEALVVAGMAVEQVLGFHGEEVAAVVLVLYGRLCEEMVRRWRGEEQEVLLEVLAGGALLLTGGMAEAVGGNLQCDASRRTRGGVRLRGLVVMDDGCWSLQDEIGSLHWLASSLNLPHRPIHGDALLVVLLEVCPHVHEQPLQQRAELRPEEEHR